MNIKLALASAALMLGAAGCSSVKHNLGEERWFNPSLPIHLQRTLYRQENAFCTRAADKWTPIPDVRFAFNGSRIVNGVPNASVEGSNIAVTFSTSETSLVTGLLSLSSGFWPTVTASAITGPRESRDFKNCMTALGWASTNDTWDGTPANLNETSAVNKAVMDSVREGYIHPLLGSGVMALIDMKRSKSVDGTLFLHTTEIPLYSPAERTTCIYELGKRQLSRKGVVRCNGDRTGTVRVSANSPIAHWINAYF